MIAKSLQEVGAARSIVIDEHGVVLAGNGTVEGAQAAGIQKIKVVDVDGDTLVAVRRTGLTDAQKRRLALFDNRTSELAEWDADQLQESLVRDARLTAGIFLDMELSDILRAQGAEGVAPTSASDEWTGMPEFVSENKMAFRSIVIHFQSQSDVDAFAVKLGLDLSLRAKYAWWPPIEKAVFADKRYASDDTPLTK